MLAWHACMRCPGFCALTEPSGEGPPLSCAPQMCCTGTCPGGVWSWVGGGVATCVGGANDGQQARCYDRSLSFKPATTKTFVNFERKSVTPQCLLASGAPAFGYKPFKDAAGAWRCWT